MEKALNEPTESIVSKINRLIGIDESYKAPERMMEIISHKKLASEVFSKFLPEFGYDLSYEWFHEYFEDEHSDRRCKKQDFTPVSVSKLTAAILHQEPQYGIIYEPAAGTGIMTISHWNKEIRKHMFPWDYRPGRYLYVCEELSDRAVPFLLFNLLIRGMNALVIHGDALTREAKDVYHCYNRADSYISFSELRRLPHAEEVERCCNVKFTDRYSAGIKERG